jgi:DNA-binding SARP family transcriptional activator
MLEIRLFGAGQALHCDQPLTGFPSQQSCLLLCYLLLNRQHPQHRERLAAVFWGDCPTRAARKHLRNALWRMRQALQLIGAEPDEYLLISDKSVSFLRSSSYWLDVEAFETTVMRKQDLPGQELTPERAARLEAAVELYAGDLLEGVYEDWCLHDRERLRLMYLSALDKLLVYHGANGAYERGLAYGERILARDKTREKVHRRMMRLYALAGARNAALAQYKLCAQILREELGIPPMERTRRLYEQLLQEAFIPSSWPRAPDTPDGSRSQLDETSPLAAHALEKLQRLQALVEEAGTELRHIERLISRALSGSDR